MTFQKPFAAPDQDIYAGGRDAAHHQGPLGSIDLVSFLRVVRGRRDVILGTAAIFVTLAIVALFQITPLYSASSIVMLNQQKNTVADVSSVLSGLPTDPASMQNQVQILTSRDLAGRVIDKLHLQKDLIGSVGRGSWLKLLAPINPFNWFHSAKTTSDALGLDADRNAAIDKFESNLRIDPLGLSTAIRVSYESPSPGEAARIDNAIADAYVEDQLNTKFDATQRTTHWLAERIHDLAAQSQAADAAVQQYRAENGLTETAEGGSVVDQQMSDISTQLVNARSDLAVKRATYSHVAMLAREGKASEISQATSSLLINTLRGQEADLLRQEADLSSRYGPRNPKMLDIQSQKVNLQGKINEEVGRVVQSLANDVAIAQAHVSSLESSLGGAEHQSGRQNQLKVKLTQLQSASAAAKSMYETFLSKLNQTQDQSAIQTPDTRIVSRASIPDHASYPNKTLVIGAAIPAGLALGLLVAFMMERLDPGFRTTAQIEEQLGLPVLATIPEVENPASRVIDKPMSAYAEAIRGLLMGLTLSGSATVPKLILVTSSVPNEGKTTTAISLARLASKNGSRVALVDADLRHPEVATIMGLSAFGGGIVDVLQGGQPLDKCLVKDPRSDVMVLPCQKETVNPTDLLSSAAMRNLLSGLSTGFDLVIVDSAPVLPVHDTKILSRSVDAVLLATRWVKTPREGVAGALRSLSDVRAPVIGVALTRADMRRFQDYSYGYQNYSNYNKYYSE
jgi:succinoglycan biosynthesis transport protein ExoP